MGLVRIDQRCRATLCHRPFAEQGPSIHDAPTSTGHRRAGPADDHGGGRDGLGKVMLCSLESGVLGEEAASLLGALIVSQIWSASDSPGRCSRRPTPTRHGLPRRMAALLAFADADVDRAGRVPRLRRRLDHGPPGRRATNSRAPQRRVWPTPVQNRCTNFPLTTHGSWPARLAGPLTADDLQGLGCLGGGCPALCRWLHCSAATGRPDLWARRPPIPMRSGSGPGSSTASTGKRSSRPFGSVRWDRPKGRSVDARRLTGRWRRP